MGNFLTRMVERSNPTAHVVRPLIAPLYAAASDQMANWQHLQSEGIAGSRPPGASIDSQSDESVLPNSANAATVVPDAPPDTLNSSSAPEPGSRQESGRPDDGSTARAIVDQTVNGHLTTQPGTASRGDDSPPGDSSRKPWQMFHGDDSAGERAAHPLPEEATASRQSEPVARGPVDLPSALHRISPPRQERAALPGSIESRNDSDDQVLRLAEQGIEEERESERPSFVRPHLRISAEQPFRDADRRSRREPEGERDPVIKVTIGRVEVRAVMPSPPPAPAGRASSRGPQLTLAEYLKRSNGGTE